MLKILQIALRGYQRKCEPDTNLYLNFSLLVLTLCLIFKLFNAVFIFFGLSHKNLYVLLYIEISSYRIKGQILKKTVTRWAITHLGWEATVQGRWKGEISLVEVISVWILLILKCQNSNFPQWKQEKLLWIYCWFQEWSYCPLVEQNRTALQFSFMLVFLLFLPDVPKFPKENLEPLEVEEGQPFVLKCDPPSGIPPLQIYWMTISK